MREILFRGKRIDNGEWVYGYYSKHRTGKTFIRNVGASCLGSFEVDPATVGQYTGLTDTNGKKIFEGDMLKRYTNSGYRENTSIAQIEWNREWAAFVANVNNHIEYLDEYTLAGDLATYTIILS